MARTPAQAFRELNRAAALHAQQRLPEAEAILQQLVRQHAQFAPALHLLGLVRHQRGDARGAQALLEQVVSLTPDDLEAHRNLGILYQETGADAQAEARFRHVLSQQPADIPSRGNLALLLRQAGRRDEAITELRMLLAYEPYEEGALRTLVILLREARRHQEEVTIARTLLRLRPDDPSLRRALSRAYFLWFDSVDQQPKQARSVLREWLEADPDDPVARHMSASLGDGERPARASDAYVERHFDEFAATFDQILTSLNYRGPELLLEALREVDPEPRQAHDVVDLGCGTGRLGPLVRPWARSLVGVDLSFEMLRLLKEDDRGYTELVRQEATAYLEVHPRSFDLILCADILPYLGSLEALAQAARLALRTGGRWLVTTEKASGEQDFVLQTSGRYAHGERYLREVLERAGLVVERLATAELRQEYGRAIEASIVTARQPA